MTKKKNIIFLMIVFLITMPTLVVMAASLKDNNWKNDGSLKLKHVDFKSIKSYTRGKEVVNCCPQGMAIGKDYVVWAQPTKDNNTTNIYIANKNTYEIKGKDNSKKFRHANGMTYNKDEDRYYVVYTNDSNGKHYISSFKISSSYKITDVKTKQTSDGYIGIAYDTDRKCFYASAGKKIKKLTNIFNSNFKAENMFTASKVELTKQDIAYFGNRIYYTCYEEGIKTAPYQEKYYNSKEKHSNLIYVYTLDGTLEKTLYLANRSIDGYNGVNGELEDAYIKEDGTIIMIYNVPGQSKVVFYQIKTDVVQPIIKTNYSTTAATKENVTVTITANEQLQKLGGWVLSSDKKTLTKEYEKNVEEKITVKDLGGNTASTQISISNIDKGAPVLKVSYSTTDITNQNVIATITANEKVKSVEGWSLSSDNKTLIKTYSTNVNENVVVKDLVGNSKTIQVVINNIDKTAPTLNVSYSTTNITTKSVTATITANEKIQDLPGWTKSADGSTLTKEYDNNIDENVTIKDLAGNGKKINIKIYNIVNGKRGDLNENNQIDIGDVMLMHRHIAQSNSAETAQKHPDWKLSDEKIALGDLNNNNQIDVGDCIIIQRYIAANNNPSVANEHPDWLIIE